MLVLTRKLMEKLYIGDEICVTVVRMEGSQVRLGIEAPRHIPVVRAELARRDHAEAEAPAAPSTAPVPVPVTVAPNPNEAGNSAKLPGWNGAPGSTLAARTHRQDLGRESGQDSARSDSRKR